MQQYELNQDFVLLTQDGINIIPSTSIRMQANGDADIVLFDYYLNTQVGKTYRYNMLNRYSILERYFNPPCIVVKKQFCQGGAVLPTMHNLLLDAIISGCRVRRAPYATGTMQADSYYAGADPQKFIDDSVFGCKAMFGDDRKIRSVKPFVNDLNCDTIQNKDIAVTIVSSTVGLLVKAIASLKKSACLAHLDVYVCWYGDKAQSEEIAPTLYGSGLAFRQFKMLHYPKEEQFNFSKVNNFIYDQLDKKYDYVLLMNDDVEILSQYAVSEMVDTAVRENAAIVGGALYYPTDDGNITYQHGGVVLGNQASLFEHFGRHQQVYKFYIPTRKVSAVTFALALIDFNIYGQLRLDEKFYGDCNDIEFCVRCIEMGGNIWYNSKATANHYESATRKKDPTMQNDGGSRMFFYENQVRIQKAFKHT